MKVLTGYLIDRTTGLGISGKTVAFTNLAGAAITTATSYAQSLSSTTDADGKFSAWFELSPGPVNVKVTAGGSEFKIRKNDETAQVGAAWQSDIQRIGWAFRDGVLPSFLNQLAVTTPSGHNIVIATGGAIIDGLLFSIENGSMTIAGTANSNPALNPRLDLVTLRQYKPTATGQDAGRQSVIVTLGTTQDVAPGTPTGADFTDYPLAVVSTGYLGSTKTLKTDLRTFTQQPTPEAMKIGSSSVPPDVGGLGTIITTSYVTQSTLTVTGLSAAETYDGEFSFDGHVLFTDIAQGNTVVIAAKIDKTEVTGGPIVGHPIIEAKSAWSGSDKWDGTRPFTYRNTISGITGVTSYDIPIQMLRANTVGTSGNAYLRSLYGHVSLRKRI